MRPLRTLAAALCLAPIALSLPLGPAVAQSADAVDLALSNNGSLCVLDADGAVDCQLALSELDLAPPADLPPLVSIDRGSAHHCGLTIGGDVRCWGRNDYGQLDAPADGIGFVQLAVGLWHNCAVDRGGRTSCWGLDRNGQSTPPAGLAPPRQVTTAAFATCALREDGLLECWGDAGSAAAGSATLGPRPTLALARVSERMANGPICGVDGAGTVRCDDRAIEGLGGDIVELLHDFASLCSLARGGTLACTGRQPPTAPDGTPVAATPPPDWLVEFAAADRYLAVDVALPRACGVRLDGTVRCAAREGVGPIGIPGQAPDVAPPARLDVAAYSDSTVELIWLPGSATGTADVFLRYEVLRDGAVLATDLDATSLLDDSLRPGRRTAYAVVTIDPRTGARSAPATASVDTADRDRPDAPSGYAVPERPFEPRGLDAIRYDDDLVELTWDRPAGVAVRGYEVRRDGRFVGFTDGVSYVDSELLFTGCRTYDVVAVDRAGTILGFSSIEVEYVVDACG